MELLTPEAVKRDTGRERDERIARNRDLAAEEERLIESVNELRQTEKEEKERVDKAIATYRASATEEKELLEREVGSLRATRAELMKPIELVRKEADDRLAAAKEREEAVEKREASATEAEDANDARARVLDSRDEGLAETFRQIAVREQAVKEGEEKLTASRASHEEEKAAFAIEKKAQNEALVIRANVLAATEKAQAIKDAGYAEIEERQRGKDRELQDRSATLERAAAEIFSKQ